MDGTPAMTRTELIEKLMAGQRHLQPVDLERAVKLLLAQMSSELAQRGRVEVRGFGSFCVHYRPPRVGRNPRTGAPVDLPGKHAPHFKPGKALRERVNAGRALTGAFSSRRGNGLA